MGKNCETCKFKGREAHALPCCDCVGGPSAEPTGNYWAPATPTAADFLRRGAAILEERGQEYDTPAGERSAARTVAAFNAITGHKLTEADGWLFLQLLKDARQWQNPDRYHADSAEDGVNYAALKAEALARC